MKTDEKLTQLIETLNNFTAFIMDQTNNYKSSPNQKDTSTPPDPTAVVPSNKKGPPLEGGHYTNICGMWTLKHEISSPKFYELLINTDLKGDTVLYIKNFYNKIKMCINAVTRIREYFPLIKVTIQLLIHPHRIHLYIYFQHPFHISVPVLHNL